MAMFAPIAAEALEGVVVSTGAGAAVAETGAAGAAGASGAGAGGASRALSGMQFGGAASQIMGNGGGGGSQPAETSGAVLDSGSGWEKS